MYVAGNALGKIKEYCKECAPDHKPEECTGKLIGTQAKIMRKPTKSDVCCLHPFRFGRNPNQVRKQSPEQILDFITRTQHYRFNKKEALLDTLGDGEGSICILTKFEAKIGGMI